MARVLGPEGRGTLGAIITWPAIFAILFIFGFQDWVSLKVSKSKNENEAKDFENQAFAWGTLLGLLGSVGCALSYFFLISDQQWEYGLLFFLYTLHTPLAVLYAIASRR
ncbi:MAG: hypothetical protein MJK18_02465 [Bdellovibrionales bacterium]|nr:hypothetical protein [Bdellovibrionales bacterium]